MKKYALLFTLVCSFNVFPHGGDGGPSSLEDEFSKLSHLHLPVKYSSAHGLSFGFGEGGSATEGTEDQGEDKHGDETGLEISVHPTFFAGFDKIRRLINLEESQQNDGRIEAANSSSPYLLLENTKWDLGSGIEAEAHLPLPPLVAGVGISFLKGKNYYTLRNLNSRFERRSSLPFPLTREALQEWRTGDQLYYATKGAVVFNVFIGIEPFVHIGPEYAHTGTYSIKVIKLSADRLSITLTTTKTDSIGIEAYALLATGGVSKSKGHLNSITYEFDLESDGSIKAINYLFNGRLDLTNREMVESVGKITAKINLQNTGVSLSGSFGIPVFYVNGGGRGFYQSHGVIQEREHEDTHESDIYTTTTMNERFSRGVFSQHKWEGRSIISTIMKGEDNILSSLYSWSLSKDKMSANHLHKKLIQLATVFDSPKLEAIDFPEKDLGYIKADFTASFSGADLLFLLNGTKLKELKGVALTKLEEDFTKYGHRSFCRIRGFENCLSRYKNLIFNKHQTLVNIRQELEAQNKAGKILNVTKQLNQFVSQLFSSRYLTQALRESRSGLKLELRLEGEKIKKHLLTL